MDEAIKLRALKNVKHIVGTSYWLIREAVSMKAAESAITMARLTGSVGSKTIEDGIMIADVMRLNPDGSEVKPK